MSESLPSAPSIDVRRCYDLCVMATASRYDLGREDERARSTRELQRLFFRAVERVAPDLFIEAGAKEAGASRRARRRLPDTRVVAFEANPYTYERFRAKNDTNGIIEYVHHALSDRPGTVEFYVRKLPDGRPSPDGQGSLLARSDYEPGHERVEVSATTVDTFFAEHPYERCALWVDVEGASRQVLEGATDALSRAQLVFIEVEDYPYWSSTQWLTADVCGCMYDAGLVPVARDFQSQLQYNLLFMRPAWLDDHEVRRMLVRYFDASDTTPASRSKPASSRAAEVRRPLKTWADHMVRRVRSWRHADNDGRAS